MAEIFDQAASQQEFFGHAGLDAMRDGAFDDITELAARFFHVSVAIIIMLRGDRVWFKSAYGLDEARTCGIDPSSWAALILAGRARTDTQRPAANDNGFRFYAAAPLRGPDGHRLGLLCVIDMKPRAFSHDDEQMLDRFGRIVMLQIEQRLASREIADLVQEHGLEDTLFNDIATHDLRTGLLNRGAIQSHLRVLGELGGDDPRIATLLIDVDHLRTVNDIHGHQGGDAVLIELARRIRLALRPSDHAGRFGGSAFVVLLVDCDRRTAARIAERVRQSVDRVPFRYRDRDIFITLSVGVDMASGRLEAEAALKAAEAALYAARTAGRNRVVFSRVHTDAVSANA